MRYVSRRGIDLCGVKVNMFDFGYESARSILFNDRQVSIAEIMLKTSIPHDGSDKN